MRNSKYNFLIPDLEKKHFETTTTLIIDEVPSEVAYDIATQMLENGESFTKEELKAIIHGREERARINFDQFVEYVFEKGRERYGLKTNKAEEEQFFPEDPDFEKEFEEKNEVEEEPIFPEDPDFEKDYEERNEVEEEPIFPEDPDFEKEFEERNEHKESDWMISMPTPPEQNQNYYNQEEMPRARR